MSIREVNLTVSSFEADFVVVGAQMKKSIGKNMVLRTQCKYGGFRFV